MFLLRRYSTLSLYALLLCLLSACGGGYWGATDSPNFDDHGRGYLLIHNATGGLDLESRRRFDSLKERDVLVIVDGHCISACTMVLYEEYENVCWTDNAVFIFHGVSLPPSQLRAERVDFPIGTRRLWYRYPEYIKRRLPDVSEWRHDRYYRIRVEDWTSLQEDRHCRDNERYRSLDLSSGPLTLFH